MKRNQLYIKKNLKTNTMGAHEMKAKATQQEDKHEEEQPIYK